MSSMTNTHMALFSRTLRHSRVNPLPSLLEACPTHFWYFSWPGLIVGWDVQSFKYEHSRIRCREDSRVGHTSMPNSERFYLSTQWYPSSSNAIEVPWREWQCAMILMFNSVRCDCCVCENDYWQSGNEIVAFLVVIFRHKCDQTSIDPKVNKDF